MNLLPDDNGIILEFYIVFTGHEKYIVNGINSKYKHYIKEKWNV